MGLYGALVVRPSARRRTTPTTTRRPSSTPAASTCCCSASIDPDLHHAVETGGTYDLNALRNRYFAINGREFPDTVQDNGSALLPNQPYGALVRIQPNTADEHPAGADPDDQRRRWSTTRSTRTATTPRQIAQDGRLVAVDRALRRDDRLRADRGLPAPLGRPGQLEPDHQPAAGGRSRTTATSSSRTATPATAAARTWATRARCRPGRPRRTSAASGTSRCTATR